MHHASRNLVIPPPQRLIRLRLIQRPKPQRIHHRQRPRIHREDVPQNPAHTRSRALIRLDIARMIMRLDLERASPPIAHVDDARHSRPAPAPRCPARVVRSPRVGSRFRCTREDLYEQCSDHITEKIPSSVSEGVRPSAASMRAYSSAVMLCCLSSAGVIVAGVGVWASLN